MKHKNIIIFFNRTARNRTNVRAAGIKIFYKKVLTFDLLYAIIYIELRKGQSQFRRLPVLTWPRIKSDGVSPMLRWRAEVTSWRCKTLAVYKMADRNARALKVQTNPPLGTHSKPPFVRGQVVDGLPFLIRKIVLKQKRKNIIIFLLRV